ncbi:riboflavin synthase [Patescibacteria group bacterium]|nr:riboflavin synthase [Patescibacteria group bacterium]
MFTGIIKATSTVLEHKKQGDLLQITFEKPKDWHFSVGDSIATNGVCLTVKDIHSDSYTAELMNETLEKSSFGKKIPHVVNLEPSLTLQDFLGGHMVQGHVDTIGVISERIDEQGSSRITVDIDNLDQTLVIPKGSITLDGISLTIVDVGTHSISVSLVDYTLKNTIAGANWRVGETVNVEYDILGKYITRYMKHTRP